MKISKDIVLYVSFSYTVLPSDRSGWYVLRIPGTDLRNSLRIFVGSM